jgi:hypothetical protein
VAISKMILECLNNNNNKDRNVLVSQYLVSNKTASIPVVQKSLSSILEKYHEQCSVKIVLI